MITSKSPRKVFRLAHRLACDLLPPHASRFSRKDFTTPQLFACLVLREHQRKSFRGIEALLRDAPEWLIEIGLGKVPDHNTLCRAFDRFMKPKLASSMLDLMVALARERKSIGRSRGKPLSLDSSPFESRHVSRHFEHRRRDTQSAGAKKGRVRGAKPSTAAGGGSSSGCRSCRWRSTPRRT